MSLPSDDPWLINYRPRPEALMRLFCLPHAGSAASAFGAWPELLPDTIDVWSVEYPGRGSRRAEPPFVRLHALVAALAPRLLPATGAPYAIFGHCVGAHIGFELARALQLCGAPPPAALCAAGSRGPGVPPRRRPRHMLDDDELVRELRAMNGTPPDVLDDPDVRALFLPTVRADLELADTYACRRAGPAGCGVFAYVGADDAELDPGDVEGWAETADGPVTVRVYPGDHFFLQTAAEQVLADLSCDLLGRVDADRCRVA